MGLFNVFISLDSTSIPTFDPSIDSINLQVKSLLYLYKRLRINKLFHLVKNDELTYTDSSVIDDDPTFAKLDKTYNLAKFKEILHDDEYRVLVDFAKNKFRSMCFINDVPTNLSRPGSPTRNQSSGINNDDEFPPFLDYKDRRSKLFKFTLFPITQQHTIELIASILSGSNIYIEHKVPFLKKYNIAISAVTSVIGNQTSSAKFSITQIQKTKIIRNYLTLLATHVQVMRIYEEYTKLHPIVTTTSTSTTTSLNHSTSKLSLKESSLASPSSTSPTKLPISKSPTKLARRESQPKLRTKPSIPKLRLEELYNPVANPPQIQPGEKMLNGGSTGSSGSITLSEDVEGKEILRLDVYERCKRAVDDKIKSERKRRSMIKEGV